MNEYRPSDALNDSVIIAVSASGRVAVHTFVGSFSGEAVADILEDVRRTGHDGDFNFPPSTFWQVGVELDSGDPSVGLPALGYVLDCSRVMQLPWKVNDLAEIL